MHLLGLPLLLLFVKHQLPLLLLLFTQIRCMPYCL